MHRWLRSSRWVFHCSSSSAACRSWPRSSPTSETTPGGEAGHQPIGFFPLVVPAEQPAGAAGQIGHVRAPMIEDQLEAGAQPVPTLLEGCDARVAAADLEGDSGGRPAATQGKESVSPEVGISSIGLFNKTPPSSCL